MSERRWIRGAIRHRGALHRELGIPENETIPLSTLRAAAKKGGRLGRRAWLALMLRGLHNRRPRS